MRIRAAPAKTSCLRFLKGRRVSRQRRKHNARSLNEVTGYGKENDAGRAVFHDWNGHFDRFLQKGHLRPALSLAITFGTVSYHLVMRLLVGGAFQAVMQNRADLRKRWYRVGRREMAVYEALKVKRWKRRMPTYDNALFDPRLHTWDEVAQAMCQAELVHETIALLSFLPIAAGLRFGAYPVFIVTSVLSAGYDLLFVMMQRYNRQRIMVLRERKRTSSASTARSAR